MKIFRRVVSGAKQDAEKVFCPDFCVLRGSDSGAGGGGGGAAFLCPERGGVLNTKPKGEIYRVGLHKTKINIWEGLILGVFPLTVGRTTR